MKGYFDNIDHHVLEELLRKEIKDQNPIDPHRKPLRVRAGYLYNGKNVTGGPGGGETAAGAPEENPNGAPGVSPLLSNVYLHESDKFMDELMAKYNAEGKRAPAPRRHPEAEHARLKRPEGGDLNRLRKVPSSAAIRDGGGVRAPPLPPRT